MSELPSIQMIDKLKRRCKIKPNVIEGFSMIKRFVRICQKNPFPIPWAERPNKKAIYFWEVMAISRLKKAVNPKAILIVLGVADGPRR